MKMKILSKPIMLIAFLFCCLPVGVFADHDHEEGRKRKGTEHGQCEKKDHDDDGNESLGPVANQTYKESCGACHMEYQPGLLPAGSWTKIVNTLDNHFGETVETDDETQKILVQYLTENSAEKSTAEISVKIMKCLNEQTPMRITEIPYIQKEHHDLPKEVFKIKSINSFSNCTACHQSANQGIYDDDHVRIPRE